MPSSQGIFIEIIGDSKSYVRAAEQAIGSNAKLAASSSSTSKQMVIGSDLAAKARVAATAKSIEAQRAEIASLEKLIAEQGATEASTLALAGANAKLNRSLGVSAVGAARVGRGAKTAEQDLNKMTRGVLAGSGALSGLGRSLAFSSTGFIAASLAAAGVVSAIKDAENLAKAQASLDVAIKHTGGNLRALGPRYQATAKAAAQFGVTEIEATTGLARATVLTGDAAAAQRAYQEALVISKATGKDFNSVLIATSKGQEGITTSLRRYGILVDSTSSGTEQFTQVMKRFGGQAAANTTATEKLHAAFTNALTTIGTALLPTFERVSGALADWLTKMNDSGKLQQDVAKGMRGIHDVASPLIGTIKDLAGAVGDLAGAWSALKKIQSGGGFKGFLAGNVVSGVPNLLKQGLENITPLHAVTSFIQSFRAPPPPPPVQLVPPSRFGLSNQSLFGAPPSTSTMFGSAQPLKQYWKEFTLNFKEQMAAAQAALTRSNKDDVAAAQQLIARIKQQLDRGTLHGPAKFAALQLLANAYQTLWAAADAATTKRAAAAQKAAAAFTAKVDPLKLEVALLVAEAAGASTIPALKGLLAAARRALAVAKSLKQRQEALQQIISVQQAIAAAQQTAAAVFAPSAKLLLDIARDQALGKSIIDDLKEEKKALFKWIKSHRKNIQGVTDAYNQITAINQQLQSQINAGIASFKLASTKALTAGLGLTADQRRELRARLSQLGPGGTTPGSGTGAGGYAINPDTGRPIHVHTQVNIDGQKVAQSTTRHQQRHRRRNPHQRRGPNAATA